MITPAQEEQFSRAVEILQEHFENFLIVIVNEDESGSICKMQYHGGLLQAIGIANAAKRKLEDHQADSIMFSTETEDE
jgi:hypothetical protein